MNELIKITEQNGKQAVSARELYRYLVQDENISNFGKWSTANIKNNDFAIELTDYQIIRIMYENGREGVDYALTLDFAKELCMLSQCENGKLARRYFIECENRLKSQHQIPQSFADALRLAATQQEQIEKQQFLIEEKTMQLDESKEWYSIKRYAQENRLNWRSIKWRALKAISYELGYTIKKIFDANYGEVNVYHRNVFSAYFN